MLSNTHSDNVSMQHDQSNDMVKRTSSERLIKLVITLRWQLQIKKVRVLFIYFLAGIKQHPLTLYTHAKLAIK